MIELVYVICIIHFDFVLNTRLLNDNNEVKFTYKLYTRYWPPTYFYQKYFGARTRQFSIGRKVHAGYTSSLLIRLNKGTKKTNLQVLFQTPLGRFPTGESNDGPSLPSLQQPLPSFINNKVFMVPQPHHTFYFLDYFLVWLHLIESSLCNPNLPLLVCLRPHDSLCSFTPYHIHYFPSIYCTLKHYSGCIFSGHTGL